MKSGLVLIDIQNDYFPGGKLELAGMERAASNASSILHKFRQLKLPVYHIRHVSVRPGATFFLPGTKGVETHSSVAPQPGEVVIEKYYPNSFRETSLYEQLKAAGLERLIICGAMSHMCIDATTRAAFDLGFSCTVVEDACATCDLQFKGEIIKAGMVHGAFMSALSMPYANVQGTAELMASAFEASSDSH